MKQIIPFKKELLFKTKVSEVTSISLEHTLSLKNEDVISGEFHISGDYKMTEGSINREKFYFKLPFEIALDSRYNMDSIMIDIDNFYYEVINNEAMQVNIDVYVEGEKLEELPEENEKQESIEKLEEEIDGKVGEEIRKVVKEKTSEVATRALKKELDAVLDTNIEEAMKGIGEDSNAVRTSCEEEQEDNNRVLSIEEEDKNQEEVLESTEDTEQLNSEIPEIESTIVAEKMLEEKTSEEMAYSYQQKLASLGQQMGVSNHQVPIGRDDDFSESVQYQSPMNYQKEEEKSDQKMEFNIFENIDNSDTYVTYHVYIVKENDTVDKIVEKYGVTKEDIALYNSLEEIKPGSKLIIPNNHE